MLMMDRKNSKDAPDSTVNIESRPVPPRIPPLKLIGAKGGATAKIISRSSYATSPYMLAAPSPSRDSGKIVIQKNNSAGGDIVYGIKPMMDTSATTASATASTSQQQKPALPKTPTFGSPQSRPVPHKRFLQPSILSKQGRVFSKDQTSTNNNSHGLLDVTTANHTATAPGMISPPANHNNQPLKLHLRKEPSSGGGTKNFLEQNQRFLPVKSNYINVSHSIDVNNVPSSIGDIQITPIQPNMPSNKNSVKIPNIAATISPLPQNLVNRIKKPAAHVVDINVDEAKNIRECIETQRNFEIKQKVPPLPIRLPPGLQAFSSSKKNPNTITITFGEHGVISESSNKKTGEEVEDNDVFMEDDSGRAKRKRKPAKQFTPEVAVPKLKIRRRRDGQDSEEATGSDFSLVPSVEETVEPIAPEEIKPDSTIAVADDADTPRRSGRGRTRQSNALLETPPKPPVTPRARGRRGAAAKSTPKPLELPPDEDEYPNEPELKPEISEPTSMASVAAVVVAQKELNAKIETEVSTEVFESSPVPRKARAKNGGRRRTANARRKKGKNVRANVSIKQTIATAATVQIFEEETRMSADIKSPAITSLNVTMVGGVDEASNMSSTSASATSSKVKKFVKDLVPDRIPVTAETIFEYRWPQTDNNDGEMYFLQEQLSEFLGVKSFKRKYPDITRRPVDMEERDYVRSHKVVSETECDLGLTALLSSDVLDIMFNDFPEKYEEYQRAQQQRREQEIAKLKGASTSNAPVVRDRSKEFYRRCLKSTAKWNSMLNQQRKEERVCSFDLQTYTLHYPAGKMKVLPPEATKVGYYPTTVLPGQYSDYYKEYTPNELKYLPLNTVLYGPVNPINDLLTAVIEDNNDDDSDATCSTCSSSSEDSGSSSDESENEEAGEMAKINEPSTDDGNIGGPPRQCKTCNGTAQKNKAGQPEQLLHCTKCDVPNHPTCLDMTVDMLPFIKKYKWQCTDCKNCLECNDPADEDKMLFCDLCDRGYHIYCIGLRKVPNGRWHCKICAVCFACGVTQPSSDDRLAEWHYAFEKGDDNVRHFTRVLCVSCHKSFKSGQVCLVCSKIFVKFEESKSQLLQCRSCTKWLHKDCVSKSALRTPFMCEPCDAASKSRAKLPQHKYLNYPSSSSQ